jgi:hypothetical protein
MNQRGRLYSELCSACHSIQAGPTHNEPFIWPSFADDPDGAAKSSRYETHVNEDCNVSISISTKNNYSAILILRFQMRVGILFGLDI